jgi:hypothetical protein
MFFTPPTNFVSSFPRRSGHPRFPFSPTPTPNSLAIVSIDGKEIWRRAFSAREHSSSSCGVETHFVDLDLSLLGHTDDEATVTVTTTLDQVRIADKQWPSAQWSLVSGHAPSPTTSLASFPPSSVLPLYLPLSSSLSPTLPTQSAGDEAWGITAVRLQPFTTTPGFTGTAVYPSPVTFDFGEANNRKAWSGSKAGMDLCGDGTTFVTTAQLYTGDTEAFLSSEYTEVPSHTLLKVAMRLTFRHPSGTLKVQVRLNSALLWEGTSTGAIAADSCSSFLPSVDISEFVVDNKDTAKIDIFATLLDGTYIGQPAPAFAISRFSLTVATSPGEGGWSSDPDTFDDSVANWLGPYVPANGELVAQAVQRTACKSAPPVARGIVLGGMASAIPNTLLMKKFTSLGTHRGLVVRMIYMLLDDRIDGQALLDIDGKQVWKSGRAGATALDASACDLADVSYIVVSLVLADHVADGAAVRLSTQYTAYASLPFGILRPYAAPLALSKDETGTAAFAASVANFDAANRDSWIGGSGTDKCGRDNSISGLKAQGSGQVDAFIAKTFTGLDSYDHLQVSFTYYYLQGSGEQTAELYISGIRVWSRARTDSQAQCKDGVTFKVQVSKTVPIDGNVADVQVWGAQDGRKGAFVVMDMVVVPVISGQLALPSKVSTFEDWSEGFVGTTQRSMCNGGYGNVLGGHCILGQNAEVSITYTNLPKHDALEVDLDYFFVNTWDYEEGQIYVDDTLVWEFEFSGGRPLTCGGVSAAVRAVSVSVPKHTADTVTIRVTSTVNQVACDESFAIDNVLVTPYLISVGDGSGPVFEGASDFSDADTIKPFAVKSGQVVTCDAGGTALLSRSGAADAPEAVVASAFTGLDTVHNFIRVSFDVVSMHATGDMTVRMSADGTVHYSATRASRGDIAGCGQEADTVSGSALFAHTRDELSLDWTARVVSKTEAIFALRNVRIEQLTYGSAKYGSNTVDTFENGVENWLGAGDGVRTGCSAPVSSTILGGVGTSAPDASMTKTYTELGTHTGVLVRFSYYFLQWSRDTDEARLRIDETVAWTQPANAISILPGSPCAGRSVRRLRASVYVDAHTDADIKLVFDNIGSIYGGQNFGIDDVAVLAVTPIGGSGKGPYRNVPDTFAAQNQLGWIGSGLGFVTCGAAGQGMRSGGRGGPAFAIKQYLGIPKHQVIKVSLKYVFAHEKGSQQAEVIADGTSVWSKTQAAVDNGACQSMDNMVTVEIHFEHISDSLTLQVWGDAGSGAGTFVMLEIQIEPLQLGSGPYTGLVSDFSAWTDGWLATPNRDRTSCTGWNTLLGGHNKLGVGAVITKVYTDIEEHEALRLEMGFVALRTW